jgi:hypothetical protein
LDRKIERQGQELQWRRVLFFAGVLFSIAVAFLVAPNFGSRLAARPEAAAKVTAPAPQATRPLQVKATGPFVGIDLSRLTETQRSVIGQAAVDFDRARQGLEPTCEFESMSAFSDGGTAIYECPHYQLTVKKSISSLQGIDGYLYGPIITFSEGNSVSDVRFYTGDQMPRMVEGSK